MLLNRTHIRPRDRAREGCVTEAQRIVQGGTHQRTEDVGGLRDPAARRTCAASAMRVTRWLAPWASAA